MDINSLISAHSATINSLQSEVAGVSILMDATGLMTVLTHIEENKDGKIIGVSNPKLTIYTKKRVEIRAATWKLLESVLQLAQALADHRNSDTNLSLHIAAMVPFASDAIEAHRKSDTSVKFDFGTMHGGNHNQPSL